MASSPTRARSLSAPAHAPVARGGATPSVVLADVVSYGYVLVVILAALQFDVQFSVLQVAGIIALFGLLRYVAHEIRADASEARIAEGRRMAALRAQSPARWSAEQRDGLGRRIDTGA